MVTTSNNRWFSRAAFDWDRASAMRSDLERKGHRAGIAAQGTGVLFFLQIHITGEREVGAYAVTERPWSRVWQSAGYTCEVDVNGSNAAAEPMCRQCRVVGAIAWERGGAVGTRCGATTRQPRDLTSTPSLHR